MIGRRLMAWGALIVAFAAGVYVVVGNATRALSASHGDSSIASACFPQSIALSAEQKNPHTHLFISCGGFLD